MKINILAIFLCLISAFSLNAQKILRGVVVNDENEKLWGATVGWNNKSAITITDSLGRFEIQAQSKPAKLIVTYVGYDPVSFDILPSETNVLLEIKGIKNLQAVTVSGKRGDNEVSTLNARHLESISSNELKKAPCCNLSESFETNGSVDVMYADAVTGAKEIQMLGLRGIYTQLLVENRPDLYGLAQPYALEYIPGTWLEGISISKGTGSVVNGYQALTGQINSELQKPFKDKPLFINLFGENTQRGEVNVHLNKKINKAWSAGFLGHGSSFQNKLDHNGDKFLDMPLKKQLNGLGRLWYETEKVCAQFNIHALTEQRDGGQLAEGAPQNPFLIGVTTRRVAAFGKLGVQNVFGRAYNQFGSQFGATWHDVAGKYGKNNYTGTQRSVYANLLGSTIFWTTEHKLTFGTSGQIDNYAEKINDRDLSRTETAVGVFGEYTFERPVVGKEYNDITVIMGLRADYHNLFGTRLVPRVNFKYNFSEKTVIRGIFGRGWRVANPIIENVSYLASNRSIEVAQNLKPEDGWNSGLNFVYAFLVGGSRDARLSIDAYRTWFTNQIVVDADSDYKKVQFYNLTGRSFANSFLVSLQGEFLEHVGLKLVYKFNDVKTTFAATNLQQMPLVARHRGLITLDLSSPNEKWMFNFTTQIVGSQRLVPMHHLPPQYHTHYSETADPYTVFNTSINRKFKTWEVYGGVENIGNFTQHNPIIASDAPESEYFDATQIYAPLMGRRIYAGLRWWLN